MPSFRLRMLAAATVWCAMTASPQAAPAPNHVTAAASIAPTDRIVPGSIPGAGSPSSDLAREAWDVLKQALIEESMTEKFNDFSEGAGTDALKKLTPTAYLGLMRELMAAPQARVRRRAAATIGKLKSAETEGLLQRALQDKALGVRLEAAAVLGARGDRSIAAMLQKELKTKNRDDRFLILQCLKRIPQKWVVNLLRIYLDDSDPFVRIAACEGLCKLGDEKAFVALRQAMKEPDKYVRSSAYAAMREAGGERTVPMLRQALQDGDATIRLYAAVYLARMGKPDGLHVLKVAMHQSLGPTLRYALIEALAVLQDGRTLPLLTDALSDTDTGVNLLAAETLLARGRPQAVATLAQAFRSPHVSIRLRAVAAARLVSPGPGEEMLTAAVADRSRHVRLAAVEALAGLPDLKYRDRLKAVLADGEGGVRVAAAILLTRVGDNSGGEALRSFVRDGAAEREEALRSLEGMRAPQLIGYLQDLTGIGTEPDRLRAVVALGNQNSEAAATSLQQIAKSSATETVRTAAVQALGGMRGDSATTLLRGLQSETFAPVRYAAACALGERGDLSAVPVLKQAVADNNLRAARLLCHLGDNSGATLYRQTLRSTSLAERIEAAVLLYRLETPHVGVE